MRHPFFDVPTPTVIGHRGSAGERPENTLLAFEHGLASGAAILETDVHLTRDGVPVLLHDDDVARVSDGAGPVRELCLAELQCLDAGHQFCPEGGPEHPFRGSGLRIPTLEEAFAAFPSARFNLELKERVPGLVERTVDAVIRAGREELTLLTSAEDPLMAELRAHLAEREVAVAQGASTADVVGFLQTLESGAPPPPGPMALQVPASFSGHEVASGAFVEHAHAHGIAVHVWTVNEIEEMQRLIALGVDGLITDFPGRMAQLLAAS